MAAEIGATVKSGLGRALGRLSPVVYYSTGLNACARATQYRSQTGIDVTWFARSR